MDDERTDSQTKGFEGHQPNQYNSILWLFLVAWLLSIPRSRQPFVTGTITPKPNHCLLLWPYLMLILPIVTPITEGIFRQD